VSKTGEDALARVTTYLGSQVVHMWVQKPLQSCCVYSRWSVHVKWTYVLPLPSIFNDEPAPAIESGETARVHALWMSLSGRDAELPRLLFPFASRRPWNNRQWELHLVSLYRRQRRHQRNCPDVGAATWIPTTGIWIGAIAIRTAAHF